MSTLRIPVDNRIRIPLVGLDNAVVEALKKIGAHANPKFSRWKAFRRGRAPKQTVRTWALEGPHLTLPRGEIRSVRAVLDEHGLQRVVLDERQHGGEHASALQQRKYALTLAPHQHRLVESGLELENCLWRSPQGSGKTEAALSFIHRVGRTALVVVSNSSLLDQWVRRCQKSLGLRPEEVGVIQGSRRVVRDVTVGMDATLRNCAHDYSGEFGMVVCDEVQRFAAPSLQRVVDAFPARYRVGVSADEKRADGMEFLVYAQFGAVGAEVFEEELLEMGWIMDVEVRVVPTNFRADWYRKLKPKDKWDQFDALMHAMSEDEERGEVAQQCVRWCLDEGEQALLLSHRREHCEHMRMQVVQQGQQCGLFLGTEENRNEFDATLEQMEEGTLRVACGTYQAIGVGFDLPRIARGVFATPVANADKADKQFRQFRGRFARTAAGKEDAVVYYLWDQHVYGAWPLTLLTRWNNTVRVLADGEWVEGKQYAKDVRREEREREEETEPSFDELLGTPEERESTRRKRR